MKLCKDCKHYRAPQAVNGVSLPATEYSTCAREECEEIITSPVTGEKIPVKHGNIYCDSDRGRDGPKSCGPDARFFVPAKVTA